METGPRAWPRELQRAEPSPAHVLTESYFFAPFRLDVASERLWRNDVPVSLRPKAFALLRYLVERPQRLVTKEALLEALWPDVVVSEDVLKSHVKDVRQALGDLAKTPLFIETVHRRGYRFIADVSPRPVPLRAVAPTSSVEAPAALGAPSVKPSASSSAAAQRHDVALFVGRQPELSRLEQELGRALSGTLRIIFISGEAGIGKTTLVQRALARFQSSGAWFTSGQCISSHGRGEAYLPLLEALGRLGRGAHGDAVVELLRRYAPSWLAKLPEFLDAETLALLERVLFGSGPERMLRELASVLPLLTKIRPLVLVLEDLQWADPSTLVLLDYLARGTELPALLVVGTYRPQDLESMDHPLRAMLQHSRGRSRSQEIELERLTPAEVAEYLDGRFDGHAFPAELARHLHARTGGSPLFLVLDRCAGGVRRSERGREAVAPAGWARDDRSAGADEPVRDDRGAAAAARRARASGARGGQRGRLRVWLERRGLRDRRRRRGHRAAVQ